MKQQGMLMLTTILMLSIMSLLILTLLQGVLLYVKASHALVNRHQRFYQLEAVEQVLRLSLTNEIDNDCWVIDKNPNEIVHLLRLKNGCRQRILDKTYQYLIEDLGEQPCLRIASAHEVRSSHHWLLTAAHTDPPLTIMQWRIAMAINLLACETEVRMIPEGVISWRQITN
jgi:hypothetical protein